MTDADPVVDAEMTSDEPLSSAAASTPTSAAASAPTSVPASPTPVPLAALAKPAPVMSAPPSSKKDRSPSVMRRRFGTLLRKSAKSPKATPLQAAAPEAPPTSRVGTLSTPNYGGAVVDLTKRLPHAGDEFECDRFEFETSASRQKMMADPRYIALIEKLGSLQAVLAEKQAALYDLESREDRLLSRIAATEVCIANDRRASIGSIMSMSSLRTPGRHVQYDSDAEVEGDDESDTGRDAKSPLHQSVAAEYDADSKDEVLWTRSADEGDEEGEDKFQMDGASTNTTPKKIYALLGSGASRAAVKSVAPRASFRIRGLSTTSESTRPSLSRQKRTVRLLRRIPNEPLGFTLKTVVLPRRDKTTGVQSRTEMCEPTFIASVTPGGIAHQSGLRAGDQILAVDGTECGESTHDLIVACIQKNTGSLTLAVKYTSDFRRAVLHKRRITLQREVAKRLRRLEQLREQECEVWAKAGLEAPPQEPAPQPTDQDGEDDEVNELLKPPAHPKHKVIVSVQSEQMLPTSGLQRYQSADFGGWDNVEPSEQSDDVVMKEAPPVPSGDLCEESFDHLNTVLELTTWIKAMQRQWKQEREDHAEVQGELQAKVLDLQKSSESRVLGRQSSSGRRETILTDSVVARKGSMSPGQLRRSLRARSLTSPKSSPTTARKHPAPDGSVLILEGDEWDPDTGDPAPPPPEGAMALDELGNSFV